VAAREEKEGKEKKKKGKEREEKEKTGPADRDGTSNFLKGKRCRSRPSLINSAPSTK